MAYRSECHKAVTIKGYLDRLKSKRRGPPNLDTILNQEQSENARKTYLKPPILQKRH